MSAWNPDGLQTESATCPAGFHATSIQKEVFTIPWFKVDDAFHSHPKVIEASNSAIGLWTLAGTWCAQYLTDGELKHSHVTRFGGTHEEAQELVDAGLWEPTDQGFRFIDWHDYQPTKESVKAARERDAERKKKGRTTQSKGRQNVQTESRRNPHGLPTESSGPDPTRPDPIEREPTPRRAKLTDDFTPSEAHYKKAKELGVDIDAELEKFKNHFIGNGDTKLDWGRTFSNWLTRSTEFNNGRPQGPPRPQSGFDPWAGDWSEDEIRRQKTQ